MSDADDLQREGQGGSNRAGRTGVDASTSAGSRERTSRSDATGTASGGVAQSLVPSISLPKGGGAIRGMGEKFAANPVTGTGSTTVPIPTSPGRSGFGPQLSLSYDSGAGNGPFGFGWSLALSSVEQSRSAAGGR